MVLLTFGNVPNYVFWMLLPRSSVAYPEDAIRPQTNVLLALPNTKILKSNKFSKKIASGFCYRTKGMRQVAITQ